MPNSSFRLAVWARAWKRLAIIWGVVALAVLVVLLVTWNTFFTYVPPDKHLVIIAKDGEPLPHGQVLAEKGQKGVQREMLGEGWHFIMPIAYTTELEDNTLVKPGQVGIVTARGGKPLPEGRLLAEEGEQGIQRRVLPPGTYRLNKHGYDVEMVPAVEIKPGFVGVQQRLLGKDGPSRFAEKDDEKGILHEVLQPGIYYINTKEYRVIPAEVGIIQTTFHNPAAGAGAAPDAQRDRGQISFTSKGGFKISIDCTVEWEVLPEDMPALVAEYGGWQNVELNVIDLQAHAIGRDKGSDYGVQDLLEGSKREKFQAEFSKELVKTCRAKNVTVHSAFIRNIEIPDTYMKQVRDRQIANETKLTNEVQQATRKSDSEVNQEEKMIEQKAKEVEYETKKLVAAIDVEVENTQKITEAEIEKLRAEYQAQIARIEAEQKRVTSEAQTQVTKLKETAEKSLYRLKMDVFQGDGDAFLRYSLAEQLNPQLRLRLFHSGPGTFWTNMDGKGMNLLLPAPGSPPVTAEKETAAP
ncbi:MAG TPA: SPFH domain-containing protein, partial [Gemmataceae bacterium]|nr:SPFH domain-containing protein [Gemmataceae bacterium]